MNETVKFLIVALNLSYNIKKALYLWLLRSTEYVQVVLCVDKYIF